MKLWESKTRFQEIVGRLLEFKGELYDESVKLESILTDVREIFPGQQMAKYVLCLEKIKYRKELDIFELWSIPKVSTGSMREED